MSHVVTGIRRGFFSPVVSIVNFVASKTTLGLFAPLLLSSCFSSVFHILPSHCVGRSRNFAVVKNWFAEDINWLFFVVAFRTAPPRKILKSVVRIFTHGTRKETHETIALCLLRMAINKVDFCQFFNFISFFTWELFRRIYEQNSRRILFQYIPLIANTKRIDRRSAIQYASFIHADGGQCTSHEQLNRRGKCKIGDREYHRPTIWQCCGAASHESKNRFASAVPAYIFTILPFRSFSHSWIFSFKKNSNYNLFSVTIIYKNSNRHWRSVYLALVQCIAASIYQSFHSRYSFGELNAFFLLLAID